MLGTAGRSITLGLSYRKLESREKDKSSVPRSITVKFKYAFKFGDRERLTLRCRYRRGVGIFVFVHM